ncbi:DUF4397 domain-containing protein [Mucilaginibacter sp. BJC16-A38]|uniref:DUF4397 domain-containing protein n=1 Tax=Mucilaginibacter phenanthrenivorans TaxID=1234842 RepID=UPI0021580A9F|nr:DUF4397 domain-containing protein [Mucilaginibacter phenanthrenivorans]MCR8556962.1 DUF4397 domain-containing protein [Mucilaginibacter phenanthrenivorans]
MKTKLLYLMLISSMILWAPSCKKNDVQLPSGGSSITIVNALVGSSSLVANFNYNVQLKYYATAQQISYASAFEFGYYSGNLPLALSDLTDTTHDVFKQIVPLPKNTIGSLYITGTLAAPESFQSTDHPPYHAPADSTVGIRFVNLSPGSSPVSVNIQGAANGSEVTTLAYKNITAFKNYAATYNISSYTFEFRDVATGTLLTTYTLSGVNNGDNGDQNQNNVRWKNITIALSGLPGSQGTFQINNY